MVLCCCFFFGKKHLFYLTGLMNLSCQTNDYNGPHTQWKRSDKENAITWKMFANNSKMMMNLNSLSKFKENFILNCAYKLWNKSLNEWMHSGMMIVIKATRRFTISFYDYLNSCAAKYQENRIKFSLIYWNTWIV